MAGTGKIKCFQGTAFKSSQNIPRLLETLSQESPVYARFQSLGFSLLRAVKRIENYYRENNNINDGTINYKLTVNTLLMYTAFANILQDNPILAREIQEQVDYYNSINPFDTDSATISIIVRQLRNGDISAKIKKVNYAFCSMLGFAENKIIGEELVSEKFLPKMFHSQLLAAIHFLRVNENDEDREEKFNLANNRNGISEKEYTALSNQAIYMYNSANYILPVYLKMIHLNNNNNSNIDTYLINISVNKDGIAADFNENKVVQIISKPDFTIVGATSSNY